MPSRFNGIKIQSLHKLLTKNLSVSVTITIMIIHCTFSAPLQHCDGTATCSFSIFQAHENSPSCLWRKPTKRKFNVSRISSQVCENEAGTSSPLILSKPEVKSETSWSENMGKEGPSSLLVSTILCSSLSWLTPLQSAQASEDVGMNAVYEVGDLFEVGIQLSYLVSLLALLGVGTFYVICQVLVRRELDLSAKDLQEQVRSGDASAMGLFELGAVMLRRKFYPAATKYLLQAIDKWDGDDNDLAQVYNALGVSYIRDGKVEKGIAQLEKAVKLQPGYVIAWNNLGDAYDKTKDINSALRAFEEVLIFDPDNKIARPRRDDLKEKVDMYRGVSVKSKEK